MALDRCRRRHVLPVKVDRPFKLDKVVKHATLFPGGFYSSTFAFVMNEDKWNKLSKDDQDASCRCRASISRAGWQVVGRGRCGRLEAMKAAGVQSSTRARHWSRTCARGTAPLVQEWIKAVNAKGVDGAKAWPSTRTS